MNKKMTKNELISSLNKIKGNPEIYLHCSYNNYKIRHIVNRGDCIIIPVGNPYNYEEIDESPDAA